MTTTVDPLDVTTPAGSDARSAGDDRIRELKRAFKERYEVEHYFEATAGSGKNIRHKFPRGDTASRPTDIGDGAIYFDEDQRVWNFYDGTNWIELAAQVLYGDTASRPSSPTDPADGTITLYYDTDEVALMYHDGTDWERVAPVDFAPTTVSARVYRNVVQSIPNNGLHVIAWTTERYDNGDMVDLGTNDEIITLPEAGLYMVGANIAWANDTTGVRNINIVDSSGNVLATATDRSIDVATFEPTMLVTTPVIVTTTETVEVQVFQNSGGNLDVLASTAASQFKADFWAYKVGG